MCEILLRVKDKPLRGEPIFDSMVSRAWDVIVVSPDGHPWGSKELTHDFWRIIKLPNVPVLVGRMLEAPEPITDPQAPNRTLHRRLYRFRRDLPALPQAFLNWLDDDTRAQPTFAIPRVKIAAVIGSDIRLIDLFVKKDPIPDPGTL